MLLALVALLPPLRPQPPGPALLSLCRGHSTNDARSQCQYRTYCWMPAGLRYSNWSRATSAPSFQSLDIQPPVIPTSSGATAPKITCNIAAEDSTRAALPSPLEPSSSRPHRSWRRRAQPMAPYLPSAPSTGMLSSCFRNRMWMYSICSRLIAAHC